MNTIPVMCQRCGAPLEVADESVRFVTCAHCSTPLEIVREASQTHSRILEEIHAATTESAKTLKVIELQNDLERLDREWEVRREQLCGRNTKTGVVNDTPVAGLTLCSAFFLAGGVVLLLAVFSGSNSFEPKLLAAAIALVLIGAFGIRLSLNENRAFRQVEEAYVATRLSLINQIAAAKHE